MDISSLHRSARPRERLAARGARALSDDELLALLLRTGYAGCGVLEFSRELTRRYPDGALGRLGLAQLRRIKGLGPSRAAALTAAFELGRRWSSREGIAEPRCDHPGRVRELLSDLIGKRKEYFVALYLDACHGLLCRETISIGTLTASLVHPREVFAPGIAHAAATVLVAHNHPSGNPEPSSEDRRSTRRLSEAGKLLGIPLLDHVVVAGQRYFSFREQGLLQ